MTKIRVISDPKILGGKPIITGTRITVELIMNFLRAGMSVSDILKEYKELKRTEVLAAIDYASRLVKRETPKRIEAEKVPAILHEITR